MCMEDPQKRLVDGKQYVRTQLTKAGLYSTATAIGCVGLVCLAGALFIPVMGQDSYAKLFHPDESTLMLFFCLSGLSGALFLGAMGATATLVKRAKTMEPVALLTHRNGVHLPEARTLIRASNLPQTDLLRAAGQTSNPPADQLLRAGQDYSANG